METISGIVHKNELIFIQKFRTNCNPFIQDLIYGPVEMKKLIIKNSIILIPLQIYCKILSYAFHQIFYFVNCHNDQKWSFYSAFYVKSLLDQGSLPSFLFYGDLWECTLRRRVEQHVGGTFWQK